MSFITKKGDAAVASMTAEKPSASDALVTLKSGMTKKVRVLSASDSVEYYAASVYKVFNTTPVYPGDNLYEKAAKILYEESDAAKDAGNADLAEELRKQAGLLRPKPRYMFGLIDLETGKPIVVDFTKKQAAAVQGAIDKYTKKLDKLAFELSKDGNGTSTVVALSPIIDMDEDLSVDERKHFDEATGKTFPADLYEQVLYVRDHNEQIADLTAFGFDVTKLGVSAEGSDDETDPTAGF